MELNMMPFLGQFSLIATVISDLLVKQQPNNLIFICTHSVTIILLLEPRMNTTRGIARLFQEQRWIRFNLKGGCSLYLIFAVESFKKAQWLRDRLVLVEFSVVWSRCMIELVHAGTHSILRNFCFEDAPNTKHRNGMWIEYISLKWHAIWTIRECLPAPERFTVIKGLRLQNQLEY